MSLRARYFVGSWITKNVRRGPGDAKDLTIRLLLEANARGIPPNEITAECSNPKAEIEWVLHGSHFSPKIEQPR
jgi:hypothetical protein